MRHTQLLSLCRKPLGLLVLSAVALCAARVNAQSGHDAFDKVQGYDNGREEQAAHNYLDQTGREDSNGDSQVEPNQSNLQTPSYNGRQRNAAGDQNRQLNRDRRRPMDTNDDNAHHHAVLGVSLSESDGRVKVIAVMPGGPAARAGLQVGDQIRYVGDQRIVTAQGLADEISDYRPGSQVELAIRRNGEKQTVTARLGSPQFTSGNRDRGNQNGDLNQQDNRQANRDLRDGRGRTAYSYRAANQPDSGSQAQLSQKLREMQRQLSQLQQQLNDLQSSSSESR